MKKFLVFSGLFSFSICSLAQAVTIQTEPALVEYYRMPDQPLDPSFTTYSAEMDIQFRDLAKSGLTETSLIDTYLRLEGYKKVTSHGDVQIEASVGEFTNWGEFRKSNRYKVKDKEVTKYYIELKYSMPISLYVKDKNGERLIDKYIYYNSDTRTWISPSYENMSDLDSYWRIQRQSRISTLQKERLQEGMKTISELINNSFGYRLIQEKARFETIGKKNHPDYAVYQKNVELIQAAFKLMDADKGLEEIKAKIKPALAFYNAEQAKYKSSSKDHERLRHICLYNQALAYFWLEEFDAAEEYVKAIQKFDSKDKDARRLLEDIEYTRSSLSHANRPSRHKVVVGKA